MLKHFGLYSLLCLKKSNILAKLISIVTFERDSQWSRLELLDLDITYDSVDKVRPDIFYFSSFKNPDCIFSRNGKKYNLKFRFFYCRLYEKLC